MTEPWQWVLRIIVVLALIAYWTTALIQGTPWWWQW
jgi:hypothetical protein